jgi:hypothetical protein
MISVQPPVERFVEIVHSEYLEMPGLHLTRPQMRRFLGIDVVTCDRLLEKLEQEKFLRRTKTDQFVRQF